MSNSCCPDPLDPSGFLPVQHDVTPSKRQKTTGVPRRRPEDPPVVNMEVTTRTNPSTCLQHLLSQPDDLFGLGFFPDRATYVSTRLGFCQRMMAFVDYELETLLQEHDEHECHTILEMYRCTKDDDLAKELEGTQQLLWQRRMRTVIIMIMMIMRIMTLVVDKSCRITVEQNVIWLMQFLAIQRSKTLNVVVILC